MPVHKPRRFGLTLTAALFLAASPAIVRAQTPWYVSYEKALSAQEQGDWKGSIALLKDAVAGKETPKLKARTYGLRFVNYLPYFHLGEAYYHLKEKRKAIENFDLCLKYGEIQQSPEEYALLQSLRGELSGETLTPAGAPAAPV